MKVVLLAGGLGTRLSEYTNLIPKPMVSIGGKPILWHIMQTYAAYGHKDFYVALGYKAEVIKEYFLNYRVINSNFTINLGSGAIDPHEFSPVDWRITLVDTGESSMTGGRVKRLKKYIGDETFMLTYGDGVADIDIEKLIAFHKSHGKMITVTAVRPPARFGEMKLGLDGYVESFKEKPQMNEGWINGGFFIVNPEFFDLIADDSTLLEREPLEIATIKGELMAYRHDGFWHCMDTKRDQEMLEKIWKEGAPWA